jgi:hypothetical protein
VYTLCTHTCVSLCGDVCVTAPQVSSEIVKSLRCVTFDNGESYLKEDFRINCASSRYRSMMAYCVAMLMLFPCGIPLFFFVSLWRHRRRIFQQNDGRFMDVYDDRTLGTTTLFVKCNHLSVAEEELLELKVKLCLLDIGDTDGRDVVSALSTASAGAGSRPSAAKAAHDASAVHAVKPRVSRSFLNDATTPPDTASPTNVPARSTKVAPIDSAAPAASAKLLPVVKGFGVPPCAVITPGTDTRGAFYYRFRTDSQRSAVLVRALVKWWHGGVSYDAAYDIDCRERDDGIRHLRFLFSVRTGSCSPRCHFVCGYACVCVCGRAHASVCGRCSWACLPCCAWVATDATRDTG